MNAIVVQLLRQNWRLARTTMTATKMRPRLKDALAGYSTHPSFDVTASTNTLTDARDMEANPGTAEKDEPSPSTAEPRTPTGPRTSLVEEFDALVARGNVTTEEFERYFYLFCRQFRVLEAIDVLAEMKNAGQPPSLKMYEYVLRLAALRLPVAFSRAVFLDGNVVPTRHDHSFGRIVRHLVAFLKREGVALSDAFYLFLINNVFNRAAPIQQTLQLLKARGYVPQARLYNRLLQIHAADGSTSIEDMREIYGSHQTLGLVDDVSFLIYVNFCLKRGLMADVEAEFDRLQRDQPALLTQGLCSRLMAVVVEHVSVEQALKLFQAIVQLNPIAASSSEAVSSASETDRQTEGTSAADENGEAARYVWPDAAACHDACIATLPGWFVVGLSCCDAFLRRELYPEARQMLDQLVEQCSILSVKPTSLLALEIKYAYLEDRALLPVKFQELYDNPSPRSQACLVTLLETFLDDTGKASFSARLVFTDFLHKDPVLQTVLKDWQAPEESSGLFNFHGPPSLRLLVPLLRLLDPSVCNLVKLYLHYNYPSSHRIIKAVIKNLYDESQPEAFVTLIHALFRFKIVQKKIDMWVGARYLSKYFLLCVQTGNVDKMLDVGRMAFTPSCRFRISEAVYAKIIEFAESDAVPEEMKARYMSFWKGVNANYILPKKGDNVVRGIAATSSSSMKESINHHDDNDDDNDVSTKMTTSHQSFMKHKPLKASSKKSKNLRFNDKAAEASQASLY